MHRPNLERTMTAAVLSLLVASLLLVGTAPVSAQSQSNGQGIPQQIAALEQRVATLAGQNLTLSQRLFALDERLAGLTPGGGGKSLRVVDSRGMEVGLMISKDEVIRKIGDYWLVFKVGADGFREFEWTFLSDRSTCDGTLYMSPSQDLVGQAYVSNKTAFYSDGIPRNVKIAAYQSLPLSGGSCWKIEPAPDDEWSVSRVLTADLSAFVPPFTVRYDQ